MKCPQPTFIFGEEARTMIKKKSRRARTKRAALKRMGCAKDTELFRPSVASRRTSCEIVLVTLLSVHSSWQFVSPTTSERTRRGQLIEASSPAPLVLSLTVRDATSRSRILYEWRKRTEDGNGLGDEARN
ncbi:hypothetical protein ALC56_10444 [Trachymyrmex septentrionalis]|uniref:Uncharacterized protein n=1 Tax=Trachymyrmex septentrionalis TaxID=34720 RepID=A0A195F5C0_9HYME|nr:hypothetical protein ALC56_10444 [Trachymyrmex septentrionalis]